MWMATYLLLEALERMLGIHRDRDAAAAASAARGSATTSTSGTAALAGKPSGVARG